MADIFISYRAEDEPYGAALIDTVLVARFGPDSVFRDSRSIRPGDDYLVGILDHLGRCSILLAVIGPRWLSAVEETDRRRLDNTQDWVRRELAEAFDRRLRVIPVLLADAAMPQAGELPAEIGRLARCQYLRVHHRTVADDLARLVDELSLFVPSVVAMPAPRQPPSQTRPGAVRSGEDRGQVRA
jgi:hypothetical protein